MTLTKRERRDLALILDLMAAMLEADMASMVIPGTETVQKGFVRQYKRYRRNWRKVQDWGIWLEGIPVRAGGVR